MFTFFRTETLKHFFIAAGARSTSEKPLIFFVPYVVRRIFLITTALRVIKEGRVLLFFKSGDQAFPILVEAIYQRALNPPILLFILLKKGKLRAPVPFPVEGLFSSFGCLSWNVLDTISLLRT